MTLAEQAQGRENLITPARLLLALIVVLGHSLMLSGAPMDEPQIHGLAPSWLAVNGFFILSGFLIAKSVAKRDFAYYIAARALRLYPAMFAVLACGTLFAIVLHVGGAVTAQEPGSWLYPVKQLFFLDPVGAFPGLFAENPKTAFDGPLWTLRYEALAYAGLPFVLIAGLLLKPARIWALWGAITLVWAATLLVPGLPDTLYSGARFASAFLLGSALQASADKIRLDWKSFAVAAAAAVALYFTPFFEAGANLVIAWVLLRVSFARVPGRAVLSRTPDWSYGLYIWHWPVFQTLKMGAPDAGPLFLLGIGLPITLLFAAVSWSFVERPALSAKGAVAEGLRRIAGRLRPAPAA